MALEELPVFFLEGFFAVVFALIDDVLANVIEVGFGNGEGPIARLPGKWIKFGALGFDPFGRGLFSVFHGFADGSGAGQIEEEMCVVFDGIDA